MPEGLDESGFEDWLREGAPHRAREGFQAELRRRFLAGEGAGAGADGAGVSEPRSEDDSLSQVESAPRKASVQSDFETFLQRYPSLHEARDAFRADLRRRFLDEAQEASPADARRGSARPARPAREGGRLLRFAPLAGVAAAAAVLFLLLPRFERDRDPGPTIADGSSADTATPTIAARWNLDSFDPETRMRLDGEVLDPTVLGPDELHERLLASSASAKRLEVDAGRLRLVFADQVGMEVQPGSRVDLVAGGPTLGLQAGEVYLTTFDGYPGHGLEVTTHDTHVMVHGTTLGVLVDPEGTCVCVAEGEVQLAAVGAEDPSASVPEGHKHFLFREQGLGDFRMGFPDLGDPNLSAAEREHTAGLQAFFERTW